MQTTRAVEEVGSCEQTVSVEVSGHFTPRQPEDFLRRAAHVHAPSSCDATAAMHRASDARWASRIGANKVTAACAALPQAA